MDGFWTPLGAPALVDWCEPNYLVSPYVAEFWNTASSFGMVVLGAVGAWRVRDAALRFRLGMLGTCAVGLGSAAFHATLLRVAQAADELPMVWLGLACVWTLADRARPAGAGRRLAAAFAVFGACFCAAYALVPWAFVLFLIVYACLVAWLAIRTVQVSFFPPAPPRVRFAAVTVILAYIGSFFAAWVPEHVLLGCAHPLQGLQLHSVWHLGAGVGTIAWWEWARLDRDRVWAG